MIKKLATYSYFLFRAQRPRLVAHAEDRDLLPLEVEAREVPVEELVPGRAAALGVCPGVPGRRSNDEAVAPGL